MPADTKVLHWPARKATLGKPAAGSTGKSQPPWAERNFSHRFTGTVPVNIYADLASLARAIEDEQNEMG